MPRTRRPTVASPAALGPGAQALLAAFLLHRAALPPAWLVRLATDPGYVDALASAGLIGEDPDGTWRLASEAAPAPDIRSLPWSTRHATHRALACLCREARQHAAEAAHWSALGDSAAALEAWCAALHEALDRHHAGDALAALDRLLALASSADDSFAPRFAAALRSCCAETSLAGALLSRLPALLALPAWSDHPALVAAVATSLAGLHAARGEHATGATVRIRAAHALRATGDLAGAARQLVAACGTLTFALHYSAARDAGEQALAAAEACGDVACQIEAASYFGLLLGMQGDTAGGRARLEHALDLALRHHFTAAAAEAYHMLGTVAEYASCYGDEQAAFARALSYCRRHDATATAEVCMGCLSYSLFRSGNWTRARRVAEEVLQRPGTISHCVAGGVLGLLHAHRGELRGAVGLLETSRAAAFRLGLLAMEFFCAWGLALVDQQAGRSESTALHYRRLLDFWSGTEDRHDAIPGLLGGALFFLDQDDPTSAAGFESALRTIATSTANPEAHGALALVVAERLRHAAEPEAAVAQAQQALAAFARRELVIERIHTLPRLAAALHACGDTAGADAAWREASLRGRRLGMRGLLALVEPLALATTTTQSAEPPPPTDAWAGLTPRQRDVARVLCTGATNKEIAARLGLGVRTIDMHVGHLLARLECRSRAEAATKITTLLS